jgi:hypothetical protein
MSAAAALTLSAPSPTPAHLIALIDAEAAEARAAADRLAERVKLVLASQLLCAAAAAPASGAVAALLSALREISAIAARQAILDRHGRLVSACVHSCLDECGRVAAEALALLAEPPAAEKRSLRR